MQPETSQLLTQNPSTVQKTVMQGDSVTVIFYPNHDRDHLIVDYGGMRMVMPRGAAAELIHFIGIVDTIESRI